MESIHKIISSIFILILLFLGYMTFTTSHIKEGSSLKKNIVTPQNHSSNETTLSTDISDWKTILLKDAVTKKEYSISEFQKPVLIETFAVWCPLCKKQQEEIKKVKESGTNAIHISLDLDPNEDEMQVEEHANSNGFDWYFSVFPPKATQSLIDEFGPEVTNAPRTPVILLCPGKKGRLLGSGIKTTDELNQAITSC